MTPTRLRNTCACLLLALAAAAQAAPPIAHFFDNANLTHARLALRIARTDKRYHLAVMDLATREIKPVAGVANADIDDFEWVNNNRLVFDLTDAASGVGEHDYAPGLFAVNRDGRDLRQLVERTGRGGTYASSGRIP